MDKAGSISILLEELRNINTVVPMEAEEAESCLVAKALNRLDIQLEFKCFISVRLFALMTQLDLMHSIVSFIIQTAALYSE